MSKSSYLQRFFSNVKPCKQEDFDVRFEGRDVSAYLKTLIYRSVTCRKSSLTDILASVAKEHQVFAQFMQQYKQTMVIVPKKRKLLDTTEKNPTQKRNKDVIVPLDEKPPAIQSPTVYVGLVQFMQKRESELLENTKSLEIAIQYAKMRENRPSENVLKRFLCKNSKLFK